jgi:hypothetical protein
LVFNTEREMGLGFKEQDLQKIAIIIMEEAKLKRRE